jgi:cyanophycin synthetase
MLYPRGTPSRIPIFSITGTNGKTTTTRLIAHVMSEQGQVVGTTNTDGVYIDGSEVRRGDTTGPSSARAVLFDPTVEVAVLETARGGILRRGLGYDMADVAVITNVSADHIGQDGVFTLNDLVHVKALVAERVAPGGTVVLNADDPKLLLVAKHPRVARPGISVVLFSTHARSHALLRHAAQGGTAYAVDHGVVVELTAEGARPLFSLDDVPITFGGAATFAAANVVAAAAASRARGVTKEALARALASFDHEQNPGRMNVFHVADARVIIDYGHNPAALSAAGDIVNVLEPARRTAVISVPGDRGDAAIRDSGAALARHFDRVVIKEDCNRRGRREGEIAMLLAAAVRARNPSISCVLELDERRAVALALETLVPGEVVVVFTDVPTMVREEIAARGGRPESSLRENRASSIEALHPDHAARGAAG